MSVADSSSPTRTSPEYSSRVATMRVPGPGSRRSSSPEITAPTPTASTASGSAAGRASPSTWKGSTSPDTSTSASISVCVSGRRTVAEAPTASSSNVTLR